MREAGLIGASGDRAGWGFDGMTRPVRSIQIAMSGFQKVPFTPPKTYDLSDRYSAQLTDMMRKRMFHWLYPLFPV